MSRSKPTSSVKSPVDMYIEWSGSEGSFKFYDKEKKENVLFPKLSFIVLDDRHSVTGFNRDKKRSYSGSMVENVKTQTIKTYLGGEYIDEDYLSNLKSRHNGLKYSKELFVAGIPTKKSDSMKLIKLTLVGSSLSSWIDFLNGANEYDGNERVNPMSQIGIIVKDSIKKKNGSTTYYEPLFETIDITEKQNDEAVELDEVLQQYLEGIGNRASSVPSSDTETSGEVYVDNSEAEEEETFEMEDDEDDLPF